MTTKAKKSTKLERAVPDQAVNLAALNALVEECRAGASGIKPPGK